MTRRLVDLQARQGIDGIYVGGSSGEAILQSREERAAYLADVAEAAAGRMKLIAHVGAVATADVLALSEAVAPAGYDAISAIPPFYYDFSRVEILAHYRAIADASALPLIVYNFPARTAGFTIAELGELFAHEKIIGIRHTSSDMFLLERIRRLYPDAYVYNGYDEMALSGFAMGAQGAIGTTYNYMGDLYVQLRRDVAEGRLDDARRLQGLANVLIEVLIAVGVMPGSKGVLDIMGVPMGHSRRPFRQLTTEDRALLEKAVGPILDWRKAR
ncbi:N-acetylneuraminate lyase [Arsenicitalea aurantiaca]|uniref:N-acetylneuraminate lyase n=1 Tax=Arsenicitalea aurantiaca TaxID=1783274 RepID=UPI001FCED61D|nr:N-acetylneuraminate lyase [Arsenicitalea aurantiaca]